MAQLLAPLPLEPTVQILSGIAIILGLQRNFCADGFQELLLDLLAPKVDVVGRRLGSILREEPAAIFFHPEQLAGLTVFACVHCAGNDMPPDAQERVLKALLLYNFYRESSDMPIADENRTVFLRTELRSLANTAEEFENMATRYEQLLDWTPTPEAPALPRPLRDEFASLLGLTYDGYSAAAICITALLYGHGERCRKDRRSPFTAIPMSGLRLEELAAIIPDMEDINRFIETAASSTAAIREQFGPMAAEAICAGWRLALISRPLLRFGDTIVCPYPFALESIVGPGLYFRLLDAYRGRDGDEGVSRFAGYFGRFFEDYVYRWLSATLKRSDVRPELVYKTPDSDDNRSCDAAVFENNRAVFVEVVAKRFRLVESVINLDEESIQQDLTRMVTEKAEQLRRKIKQFQDGVIVYTGINPGKMRRIYPIIVVSQPVPHFAGFQGALDRAFHRPEGESRIRPIQVVEIDELENLEKAFAQGRELSSILDQKTRRNDTSMISLSNFITEYKPNIQRGKPVLMGRFNRWYKKCLDYQQRIWGFDPSGVSEGQPNELGGA